MLFVAQCLNIRLIMQSQNRVIKKILLDEYFKCPSNWAYFGCPTLIAKEIFTKRGHVTKPDIYKFFPYVSSPFRSGHLF